VSRSIVRQLPRRSAVLALGFCLNGLPQATVRKGDQTPTIARRD
jgi:hypothetical protein